jgi:hypothetical protein
MNQNYQTEEAAKILGVRPCTLEAWRCRGGGPEFLKLGKAVRYRQSDLEFFMQSRLRKNTTKRMAELKTKIHTNADVEEYRQYKLKILEIGDKEGHEAARAWQKANPFKPEKGK